MPRGGRAPDSTGPLWMAALALAVDGEFQRRTGGVVTDWVRATVHHAVRTSAAPKGMGRMIGKGKEDHLLLEMPRAGNNVDVCRCGVESDLAGAAGLLGALRSEFERNGGGVVRVKNDFRLGREEAAAKFGYRTVLTNYRMVCETVTYRDVLAALVGLYGGLSRTEQHYLAAPLIAWLDDGQGEDPLAGTEYRDGGYVIPPHPRVPGLASGRLDEPVTLVVETQLILPVFLAGRKLSHWPYKYVRCERPAGGKDGHDGSPGHLAIRALLDDLS